MNRHIGKPAHGQQGFALVFVLWVVMLLSLLGVALQREMVANRADADLTVWRTQARLADDGAINRVFISLLDPADPDHWPLNGTARQIAIGDVAIRVAVTSEFGKIDLNASAPALFSRLFAAKGVDTADADRLADRIAAWRSPNGDDNDAAAYPAAHRPYTPPHRPFRSVGELRLVLGLSDALQASIAPLLTVWSGNADIDRAVASSDLLALSRDMGDVLSGGQLSARAIGQEAGADRLVTPGEAVTIVAIFTSPFITLERRAVVRLSGDQQRPLTILVWE